MPPVKKPRGRPRLSDGGAQDDEQAKKRARLRDAQHAFRARKDATIGDLQQRVGLLEDVIDGMSTSMASVTDVLVREGVLGKNQAVDKHYADAMQYFVGLARTAATASDPDGGEASPAVAPPPPTCDAESLPCPGDASPKAQYTEKPVHAPLSPRLGSAAFPDPFTLPHPMSTVPYTKDLDPIMYTFTPIARKMLLFLTAGRDDFIARMYLSITRKTFEGFASGNPDSGRMFFRFSCHQYDAAEVAERVFATMQLILFGSYDSSLSPPFHLPSAPQINSQTIASSRTLTMNTTKTKLEVGLQASSAAARRRLDYKSLLLNNLKSAVHKDMISAQEDISGYVDAFDLIDYLRLNYNVHIKGPDALRIVLPAGCAEPAVHDPFDVDNFIDFDAGVDSALLSIFQPSPPDSLDDVRVESFKPPQREAVISSELLFDGLYTAGVCAGQGVMFDKRQLDGTLRSIIANAAVSC